MHDKTRESAEIARLILTSLFAVLTFAAGPTAKARSSEEPVRVEQEMRIDGRTLRYVAETGRVPIRDAQSGEPHGHMFYIAYRVASREPRPLVFLWNGGPGSNSTLLHFEAFGPRRLEKGRLVDNEETLLPVADMVFVDPIGTGFSRPAKAEYAEEFYGTLGDIRSVTEFVRAWRLLHDAWDAPLFLAGESWGAGRAGSVAHALETRGINIEGLVLISGGSGVDADVPAELSRALRIVNLAVTALYHGKISPSVGATIEEVQAEVGAWARDVYAPALARVDALTDGERETIAEGLALRSGLPLEIIDGETLLITPRQFRTELLKEEGKTLNTFDMRITAGGERSPAAVISNYLRRELGYRTDLVYVGLEGGFEKGYVPDGEAPLSVGARWDYFTVPLSEEEKRKRIEEAIRVGGGPPRGGPPLPSTEEAIALNSDLRALVASGLYDSLANCAGSEEAERRLGGALAQAVTYICYVGGHMMYRDEPTRIRFSEDVKALITGELRK